MDTRSRAIDISLCDADIKLTQQWFDLRKMLDDVQLVVDPRSEDLQTSKFPGAILDSESSEESIGFTMNILLYLPFKSSKIRPKVKISPSIDQQFFSLYTLIIIFHKSFPIYGENYRKIKQKR